MAASVLSLIVLAVMFLLAPVLPLNMAALAFVEAFPPGPVFPGMSTGDIPANFPGGLFLTIVGVTCLFAIAQNNSTIDLLVRSAQTGGFSPGYRVACHGRPRLDTTPACASAPARPCPALPCRKP